MAYAVAADAVHKQCLVLDWRANECSTDGSLRLADVNVWLVRPVGGSAARSVSRADRHQLSFYTRSAVIAHNLMSLLPRIWGHAFVPLRAKESLRVKFVSLDRTVNFHSERRGADAVTLARNCLLKETVPVILLTHKSAQLRSKSPFCR